MQKFTKKKKVQQYKKYILLFSFVDLVVRQRLPEEELKEKEYVIPLKTTHH